MRFLKGFLLLSCFLGTGNISQTFAQQRPKLQKVYFNLYTDSLKPVLNYYVNVEGKTVSGNYLPLDTSDVLLTADWGVMQGNEWVIPKVLLHDSVTFTVVSRQNPALRDRITIWIQKWKDPRDAPGYEEPETNTPFPENRRRRR